MTSPSPALSLAAGEGALDIDAGPSVTDGKYDDCINAVYSLQKLIDLLREGDDTQIEFALGELEQLFKHCLPDALLLVVPVVCSKLCTWTQELQLLAGQKLLQLEQYTVGGDLARAVSFSALLVIRETNNITMERAGDIYDVFSQIAIVSVPRASWKTEDMNLLIKFVDQYSESPFPEDRKVAVAFIQGLCSTDTRSSTGSASSSCKSDLTDSVQRLAFRRLWKMAEDPSSDVLGRCLKAIGSCGKTFSALVLEEKIWPLVQRAWSAKPEDVNSLSGLQARQAAIYCVAQLCEARNRSQPASTNFERKLLPEFLRTVLEFTNYWCGKDQRDVHQDVYDTEIAAATHFGQLLVHTYNHPQPNALAKTISSGLKLMVSCNGPNVREKVAYNMPGICAAFCNEKGAGEALSSSIESLASDSDSRVRVCISSGYHETARYLSPRVKGQILHSSFCALLEDDMVEVRTPLILSFSDIVCSLTERLDKTATATAISKFLTSANIAVDSGDWRLIASFAKQAQNVATSFAEDAIIDVLIAMLMKHMTESRSSVGRQSVANAIVSISRTTKSARNRDKYVSELMATLTHGPVPMRMAAIEASVHGIGVFSEVLFTKLFATSVLRSASDPVPNVRLRLAKRLPALAPRCQGHELFEPAIELLKSDSDPDVREVMNMFVQEASKYVAQSLQNESEAREQRVAEMVHFSAEEQGTSRQHTQRVPPSATAFATGLAGMATQKPASLGKKIVSFASSPGRRSSLTGIGHLQTTNADGKGTKDSLESHVGETSARPTSRSSSQPGLDRLASAMTWSSDGNTHSRSRHELDESPPTCLEFQRNYTETAGSMSIIQTGLSTWIGPSGSTSSFHRTSNQSRASDGSQSRGSGLKAVADSIGVTNLSAQALPVQSIAKHIKARRMKAISISNSVGSSDAEDEGIIPSSSASELPTAFIGPGPIKHGDSSLSGTEIAPIATQPHLQETLGSVDSEEIFAGNRRPKFLRTALRTGLKVFSSLRRTRRVGAGRARTAVGAQDQNGDRSGDEGLLDSEVADPADPSTYIENYDGSPPWARPKTNMSVSVPRSSSSACREVELDPHELTGALREPMSLDETAIVAPGTVRSLLKKWESLET